MYSGITSGRVLNGELLYTKVLEVNLFALPTDCFVEISPHSTGHIAWCTHSFLQPYIHFLLFGRVL